MWLILYLLSAVSTAYLDTLHCHAMFSNLNPPPSCWTVGWIPRLSLTSFPFLWCTGECGPHCGSIGTPYKAVFVISIYINTTLHLCFTFPLTFPTAYAFSFLSVQGSPNYLVGFPKMARLTCRRYYEIVYPSYPRFDDYVFN